MTLDEPAAFAALIFVLAALYTTGFQLALASGAPWGDLTLGGRWPGKLPPMVRALSAAQALSALAMIGAVLDETHLIALGWPAWPYQATLVVCLMSVIANAATPSKPERKLGLPVAAIMLVSAGLAGWL